MHYSYPLRINFKLFAIAPQMTVLDAQGQEQLYIEQKLFRLKEDVRVFSDTSKSIESFRIKADRVLDFNAEYVISESATGTTLGSVVRDGMKSLLKASYTVKDSQGNSLYTIQEANPWVKVVDAVFELIPIVGMFAGYLFHPRYSVINSAGQLLLTMHKKPSFTEASYDVTSDSTSSELKHEPLLVLALMMIVLLERSRG